MDDLDRKIVTLLRGNGRRSVSDLALEAGASRATVRARIERMEEDGTIIGYTVMLRAAAPDDVVRGVMMVEIDGLSYWHLEQALEKGLLPTLQKMIDEDGYAVSRVDCGLPSMTSACILSGLTAAPTRAR